ncbi:MAG: CoB--CoM heterodisulfide reductase iron-sulfur subunit A family protein [Candidatus Bathyarchaeota archaeon]|nr:MAG: CoB--CoM heterodisulfide reductase iron-sulfur subunit A family protein [Candidatus Bathyarchaeota archaeon]
MMEEAKIGVFVCRCGTNIGGYLDVPALVNYSKGLPNVVCAQENLYTCSEAGLNEIKEAIIDHQLNRVIVASCTPRTHEPLFRNTCKEAGLNPYLFEFVNIRDQCSWVHMHETEKATEKAKDLIRMGVARAKLLEPQEEIEVDVVPSALVIGGGIAGMTCALSLADRGFEVTLVEREEKLGGMLRKLYKLYSAQTDASQLIEAKIGEIEKHRNIEVLTSATVTEVKGFYGNYDVTIRQERKNVPFRVGVIVVAIGAEEFKPVGMYGYDGIQIVTQLELEEMLKEDRVKAHSIVMIQCVGARDEKRSYCAKVCCTTALNNAMIISERNPKAQIFMLYRDLQTYGTIYEDLYKKAREKGIIFVKYSPQNPPIVDKGMVKVFDEFLGEELRLPYELVVLSTPMVAHPDSGELAKILKVPIDEYGFFLEAHVKLRPLDFATDGVYVCGSAHWPVTVDESIVQGYGAASRASIPMSRRRVVSEPIVSFVDEESCIGCGLCEMICPFKAIQIEETPKGKIAQTIVASCKGCGTCGAACPQKAITMRHFKDEQMLAEIVALMERK